MCLNPILTIKGANKKIISPKELKEIYTSYAGNKKFFELFPSEKIVELPCGKCQECLKSKIMEWSKRIKKELSYHKTNYVLNLTYDNNNIKKLNKRDLQLFFKKLRKKYTVRYFYIGELGEKTKRPHYHCIMFGLEKPKDIIESKRPTKRGNKQYESAEIEKIWGKGLITLNIAEKSEINYLFKYMMKDKAKKDFIYQMSKKPPIGINPETIENEIKKPNCTKGEKNYYIRHFGELPKEITEQQNEKIQNKIFEIEKQTKLKYINYIKQKRISAKIVDKNKNII